MALESERTKRRYLDLDEVRPLENVAVFRMSQLEKQGAHPTTEGVIYIPLSEIGTVWSVKDGDWCLTLKGQIQKLGESPF